MVEFGHADCAICADLVVSGAPHVACVGWHNGNDGRVARSTARLDIVCLEKRAPPELGEPRLLAQLLTDGSPSSVEGAALEMP